MQSVWTVYPMQSVWTVPNAVTVNSVPNAVSVNSAQCSQCGQCGQWAKVETSDLKTHQVRTLHRAVLTLGCSWHACDHDEGWVVLSPRPLLISTFSPATGWWHAGTPGTSKTKPSNISAHTPGWNSSNANDQRQVHSYILSFSHKATRPTVCPFVSSQQPYNEKCAQYFVLSELGVHVHYLSLHTIWLSLRCAGWGCMSKMIRELQIAKLCILSFRWNWEWAYEHDWQQQKWTSISHCLLWHMKKGASLQNSHWLPSCWSLQPCYWQHCGPRQAGGSRGLAGVQHGAGRRGLRGAQWGQTGALWVPQEAPQGGPIMPCDTGGCCW